MLVIQFLGPVVGQRSLNIVLVILFAGPVVGKVCPTFAGNKF